jgi:hypothetical protein
MNTHMSDDMVELIASQVSRLCVQLTASKLEDSADDFRIEKAMAQRYIRTLGDTDLASAMQRMLDTL